MKIEIIKCLQDNYSYLIIDEPNLNACVVDPSEAKPIIDFVESNNIKLKYILNTHHHFDHVGGNIELKKKYNTNIIGFKGDRNRIPEIDTLVDDLKILKFIVLENLKKSFIVHICIFGVLYHSLGRVLVTGIVPLVNKFNLTFQ